MTGLHDAPSTSSATASGLHRLLRRDARSIFEAGLRAACPRAAVQRFLSWDDPFLVLDRSPARPKLYDLTGFRRVWVLGAGKAARGMAEGLHGLIGDRVTGGCVIVPEGQGGETIGRIQLLESGHPDLGPLSIQAAAALAEFGAGMADGDLCIALISGGASSLVFQPVEGLEIEAIQDVIGQLGRAGAPIQDINKVRRQLCRLKGGGLGDLIAPAELLTLVVSDIVGNPLADIGSGLTIGSDEAPGDLIHLLESYGLDLPQDSRVRAVLAKEQVPEGGDPLKQHEHRLILDNTAALLGCAAEAKALGYEAITVTSTLVGEARELGALMVQTAEELVHGHSGLNPPAVLLFGGESTVRVGGSGRGGRNQELALASVAGLSRFDQVILLSAGTDGDDGGTGVAGAIVDSGSAARLHALGEDPDELLGDNNSAQAFEVLGDQVTTGPTGTNVMDLQVLLAGPKPEPPKRPLLPG